MLRSVLFLCAASVVNGRGLLILYRPKDISYDCVYSHHLRYDLSFGMGMSDTVTLVLRNFNEIDYKCNVEIVTQDVYLIVVIRFPNAVGANCATNKDAFKVMKKEKYLQICSLVGERDTSSSYFILTVKKKIRFQYLSNSSINTDMNADLYQVTATTARKKPQAGCNDKNESYCILNKDEFCFTSGVVCDGIKNCGLSDWFDERKSDCELPVERIGFAPVITVVAVIFCLSLAASHLLMQYLPPLSNSFFNFNANEDNRLCMDTVFKPPDSAGEIEKSRRQSLIPVSSSTSDDDIQSEDVQSGVIAMELERLSITKAPETLENSLEIETKEGRRKTKIKMMTEMLQERLRSIVSGRKIDPPTDTSTGVEPN